MRLISSKVILNFKLDGLRCGKVFVLKNPDPLDFIVVQQFKGKSAFGHDRVYHRHHISAGVFEGLYLFNCCLLKVNIAGFVLFAMNTLRILILLLLLELLMALGKLK